MKDVAFMTDIVVVSWPAEAAKAVALAEAGTFRLLLVDPEADPPVLEDARADWLRMPADERDVAARVLSLTRRRDAEAETPHVDQAGRLFYGGRWVALSPVESRLASALGQQCGVIVAAEELIDRVWPHGEEGPSSGSPSAPPVALRVHLARLRKRVEPLGLEVRAVHSGLVMLMQPRGRALMPRRASP
jgi:hypothetical protein